MQKTQGLSNFEGREVFISITLFKPLSSTIKSWNFAFAVSFEIFLNNPKFSIHVQKISLPPKKKSKF